MRERWRREHGSVLMLVPAGVLVLFVLGAIAVDFAIAFLAQRELTSAAAAAANDAATAAMSDEVFYRGGSANQPGDIDIDDETARRFVARALDERAPAGITEILPVVVAPGRQVCVTITGRVHYIFAKAIPGGPRGRTVTGRAVATAVEGPSGTKVTSRAEDAC